MNFSNLEKFSLIIDPYRLLDFENESPFINNT